MLSIFLFQSLNLFSTSCQLHISCIFILAILFRFYFLLHLLFSQRRLIASSHWWVQKISIFLLTSSHLCSFSKFSVLALWLLTFRAQFPPYDCFTWIFNCFSSLQTLLPWHFITRLNQDISAHFSGNNQLKPKVAVGGYTFCEFL